MTDHNNAMTKRTRQTTKRFATVALAGIATAIPVLAMVPAVAAPTPGRGIVQIDRPWGPRRFDSGSGGTPSAGRGRNRGCNER
jgi:hypothetical protein